ncbi:hypothetical protein ACFPPD_01930 [Cohnella suwonensis]|uniref:Uncharacterized protein n=1 Tax=Cohnella suwonensis TaxID=696072 RepID=A0ABW0LNM3_9BACL
MRLQRRSRAPNVAGTLGGGRFSFGYADESGKRLLGFDFVNPSRFVQAVAAIEKAKKR